MQMNEYQRPRSMRTEARTIVGRTRGGKLQPVMAVPFRESESGMLEQSVTVELDPIAGRLITPVTAEITAVYVPALAIHAMKYADQPFPGVAENFRQMLLSGQPVFGLETSNDISDALCVEPRAIGPKKKVNEAVRIAHNCAVNYLRQRKHVSAAQIDMNNFSVTPALLGSTVLKRLNAVLDPEDRVNGAVSFNVPSMALPVIGLGVDQNGAGFESGHSQVIETDRVHNDPTYSYKTVGDGANVDRLFIRQNPANPQYPYIRALFDGSTQQMSLTDLYNAERIDALTREFRQIVDENPQYGEEIITRLAHGLSVELGATPFVLYEKQQVFGMNLQRAMDGPSLDVVQTNSVVDIDFTVPVPATEFGGIVVTFVSVKPDETIPHQPHPILSVEWGARNHVEDELVIDPVPVTIRDLHADAAQADQETVVCYVGNNHLEKNYVNYGFRRDFDRTTVEAKSAIWQIEVPFSVTPESVLYPYVLDHYPFADNSETAEPVEYTIRSRAQIMTPRVFGPTPVEELAEIENENIFGDAE
ncbi:hypothetical protein [Phaeobacter gallaeciensis]|uniref:hypothetical protein n=1 Tax=Phaeobacter gallaeciensis TaxID=60890 RepID=UPI00237FA03E|nr:hypothetical protein [Phaeobacter gallaeciensis]MDE4061951.1 hypothetical protein [Phaeobacter gallaeciensis]MDE4124860.1 hypothetical protein [Phaeobacter gallaeciensis]MDE4129333.1 hypothetical protein [Phaeobacter gallaeciensis]